MRFTLRIHPEDCSPRPAATGARLAASRSTPQSRLSDQQGQCVSPRTVTTRRAALPPSVAAPRLMLMDALHGELTSLRACAQYHKLCLKCVQCNRLLDPRLLVDHDGQVRPPLVRLAAQHNTEQPDRECRPTATRATQSRMARKATAPVSPPFLPSPPRTTCSTSSFGSCRRRTCGRVRSALALADKVVDACVSRPAPSPRLRLGSSTARACPPEPPRLLPCASFAVCCPRSSGSSCFIRASARCTRPRRTSTSASPRPTAETVVRAEHAFPR